MQGIFMKIIGILHHMIEYEHVLEDTSTYNET